MTSEQRLDRLERIAKLVVRAGLRARRTAREQEEKINMIIDAQMKNEERFASQMRGREEEFGFLEGKIEFLINAQIKNEERFARLTETQTELAAAQKQTTQRLDSLIDLIKEGRNGKP